MQGNVRYRAMTNTGQEKWKPILSDGPTHMCDLLSMRFNFSGNNRFVPPWISGARHHGRSIFASVEAGPIRRVRSQPFFCPALASLSSRDPAALRLSNTSLIRHRISHPAFVRTWRTGFIPVSDLLTNTPRSQHLPAITAKRFWLFIHY